MKKLIFFIILLLSINCVDNDLGSRISKGIIEVKARQEGEFCYINNQREQFCVVYIGLDTSEEALSGN